MMIRRWEVVDTKDGEIFHHVSKHLTRRGAEWSIRICKPFLRVRPGYALRAQRRKESA